MIKNILLAVIIFLIGIAAGTTIANWQLIIPTFFQLRFIEIVQTIIALTIALFITYYVNSRVGQNLKKREILCELLSDIEGKVNEALTLGYDYLQEPTAGRQSEINRCFKHLSIMISIIKGTEKPGKKCLAHDATIHQKFLKFKGSLTDKPFSTKTMPTSDTLLANIQSAYSSLLKTLYEYKLTLYSE